VSSLNQCVEKFYCGSEVNFNTYVNDYYCDEEPIPCTDNSGCSSGYCCGLMTSSTIGTSGETLNKNYCIGNSQSGTSINKEGINGKTVCAEKNTSKLI
jgi:hypothetical protein